MDNKTTSIKSRRQTRRSGGWSLIEMMMAVAVFAIVSLALSNLFIFGVRSMAAMANYASLDKENREALDLMTREVRQAQYIAGFTTTPPSLTVVDINNAAVTYKFDDATKRMLRQTGGTTAVLLTNCTILNFKFYQRNPTNGFAIYEATNQWALSNNLSRYVKVIELSWKTSKSLNPTTRINSENVQTARIVLRNQ